MSQYHPQDQPPPYEFVVGDQNNVPGDEFVIKTFIVFDVEQLDVDWMSHLIVVFEAYFDKKSCYLFSSNNSRNDDNTDSSC